MTNAASSTAGDPLPPEVSGDGRRNAYYLDCSVMGCKMSYASCLHKISERKKGALVPIYAACSAAIGNKTCPALVMQRQEKEAKRALYFIERERFGGIAAVVDKAKQIITKLRPTPAAPAAPASLIGDDYMAQAINAAVKDEAKDKHPFAGLASSPEFSHSEAAKRVGEAVAKAKAKAKPGESMVEMGRRLLAERASKKS